MAQPDLCPSRIALCLAADQRSSRFPARVPWTGRSDGPEKAVPHLMPEERRCAALLLPMRHITACVARVRTADPPSPCRRSRTPRVTLPCLFGAQVARFRRQFKEWPVAELSRCGYYMPVSRVHRQTRAPRLPLACPSLSLSVPACCIFQVCFVRANGKLFSCVTVVLLSRPCDRVLLVC